MDMDDEVGLVDDGIMVQAGPSVGTQVQSKKKLIESFEAMNPATALMPVLKAKNLKAQDIISIMDKWMQMMDKWESACEKMAAMNAGSGGAAVQVNAEAREPRSKSHVIQIKSLAPEGSMPPYQLIRKVDLILPGRCGHSEAPDLCTISFENDKWAEKAVVVLVKLFKDESYPAEITSTIVSKKKVQSKTIEKRLLGDYASRVKWPELRERIIKRNPHIFGSPMDLVSLEVEVFENKSKIQMAKIVLHVSTNAWSCFLRKAEDSPRSLNITSEVTELDDLIFFPIIFVPMCQRCLAFDHSKAECKSQIVVCSRCSGNHSSKGCKQNHKCVHCKGKTRDDHSVYSSACPVYYEKSREREEELLKNLMK